MPQMAVIRLRRYTAARLAKTIMIIKYIFPESLKIVDNEGIFIKIIIKKIKVFRI